MYGVIGYDQSMGLVLAPQKTVRVDEASFGILVWVDEIMYSEETSSGLCGCDICLESLLCHAVTTYLWVCHIQGPTS